MLSGYSLNHCYVMAICGGCLKFPAGHFKTNAPNKTQPVLNTYCVPVLAYWTAGVDQTQQVPGVMETGE